MALCSLSPSSYPTEEVWLRKQLLQYTGDTKHPLICDAHPPIQLLSICDAHPPIQLLSICNAHTQIWLLSICDGIRYGLLPNMDDAFAKWLQ